MMNKETFYILGERLEDGNYVLVCVDEESRILRTDFWGPKLFLHHASSFYGTMFVEAFDEKIVLSPIMALELFAGGTHNQFFHFSFDEAFHRELEIAPAMYEAIQAGQFMPDFEAFQKGELRFRPIEGDIEDVDWFSECVMDVMAQNPVIQEAWNTIVEKYPVIKTMDGQFIDEEDFLERIGWKVNDLPFTIGLRLNEPEWDGDDWKIELFLRNRKSGDVRFFTGVDSLPARWKPHFSTFEREQERFQKIVPWLSIESGTALLSEDEAWRFLTEASETFVHMGIEILLPSWWDVVREAKMMIKAKMPSSTRGPSFVGLNSLVDFDWRFATNGVEMTEEEFLKLVDGNRRLVHYKGQWIKLDPAFIAQVKKVLQRAETEGLHVQDILQQEFLASDDRNEGEDDLRAFANIQIELNAQMKKLLKQMNNVEEIPIVDVPKSLHGELRPYQHQGVNWLLFLRQFGFGACLADDMGLGKTVQMITYFLSVKEREGMQTPALIIAPTSVLGNWQKELEKFAPSLNVKLHYGPNRQKGDAFEPFLEGADVIITSYGLSHGDFDELSSVTWNTICLDEAQNIKNAHTKQSRAIRKLKGVHHIALTGTPMENRLSELWSIFDFINKGYLGTLHRFQQTFVAPIEKDRSEEKIEDLRRLIKPFLLRRTKRDEQVQLNLPDKQEQKEYIALTVEQASLYEQLVKDTFDSVLTMKGFERKALILQMLGKLKQLCNHPALYLKEDPPTKMIERSHKLEKLIDLIGSIQEQGESCLIFTQYIKMGEMMKELLQKEFNTKVLFLNGSLSKTERDKMVESFQNREATILILSLKAGGTGLNLTAANHVIHFDRWWNPAVENQATDRAYRIGQKRFVHVHKFITTGTIEEKIDQMIEKKQSLNDEIIQSDNWITELSSDELKELFTLTGV